MLTLLNLVYVLPVVIALIIAAAVVNSRVTGTARTLMWTGVALTCATRLAGMFTPYLVMNRNYAQLYTLVNIGTAVLSAVGIVLLVVAIGAAARSPRPAIGYPGAPTQPGWPPNQPGQPSSFGAQNHPGAAQPGGYHQPGAGGQPGAGQAGEWTAPGHWTDPR